MSEKCMRCQSVGEDRRTLMMRCFWDMSTMGIPFETEILFHADFDQLVQHKTPVCVSAGGHAITIQAGTVTTTGELTPEQFYTLRVCKRCRGEWMTAIKQWFIATHQGRDADADNPEPVTGCGSGIFVRRNGVNVEITQEEWDRDYGRMQP